NCCAPTDRWRCRVRTSPDVRRRRPWPMRAPSSAGRCRSTSTAGRANTRSPPPSSTSRPAPRASCARARSRPSGWPRCSASTPRPCAPERPVTGSVSQMLPEPSVTWVAAAATGGAGVPIRELALLVLTAAVITFLVTGVVRKIALRVGAVAVPRQRDVHIVPTPRLGGVGMYVGVLIAFALASRLPALTRGFEFGTDVVAVAVGGLVIVVVGIIDDTWGLDALTKFVGQLTAAGAMVALGIAWFLLF